MPLYVFLAAAAVAAAIPLLVWSVASARSPRSEDANRNLFQGLGVTAVDARQLLLERSASDRAVRPMVGWLARRARRLTPAGWVASLDRRIALAGRPEAWTLERVLAAKVVLAAVGLAFSFLVLSGDGGSLMTLFAVGVPVLGYFAPDLLLHSQGQKRQLAIQRALPDTMDQLSIAVEAGLGFEAAMAHAGRNGAGPLADELVRTLQDMQVGATRTQALKDLATRTQSPDLRHFVTAVIQAEGYGIPIADVLRTQAGELRIKRRQRAEERAQKMPVKLVFPLVVCILPALFVVIIGPGIIRIAQTLFSSF